MTTQNQDAVGNVLDAFLQKLHLGAGDKMQQVAERLATLGDSLQGLRSGLQDTADRMAESAELMARRMGEGAEEALSRITNQMGLDFTVSLQLQLKRLLHRRSEHVLRL